MCRDGAAAPLLALANAHLGRALERAILPVVSMKKSAGLGHAIGVDEPCGVLQRLAYVRLGYAMPVGKLLGRRCVETSSLDKVQCFCVCIKEPRNGGNA